MKIPEVRARLMELTTELNCAELATLAEELKRRKPLRPRSRARRPRLTDEQAAEAKRLYMGGMAMHEVALRLGTNIGRVSEAVQGFRE